MRNETILAKGRKCQLCKVNEFSILNIYIYTYKYLCIIFINIINIHKVINICVSRIH